MHPIEASIFILFVLAILAGFYILAKQVVLDAIKAAKQIQKIRKKRRKQEREEDKIQEIVEAYKEQKKATRQKPVLFKAVSDKVETIVPKTKKQKEYEKQLEQEPDISHLLPPELND